MTMTIKLAAEMEQRLRRRSAALGKPASALIREALVIYLDASVHADASAYELGADLFGRHRGDADLAESRKARAAQAWTDKHASWPLIPAPREPRARRRRRRAPLSTAAP